MMNIRHYGLLIVSLLVLSLLLPGCGKYSFKRKTAGTVKTARTPEAQLADQILKKNPAWSLDARKKSRITLRQQGGQTFVLTGPVLHDLSMLKVYPIPAMQLADCQIYNLTFLNPAIRTLTVEGSETSPELRLAAIKGMRISSLTLKNLSVSDPETLGTLAELESLTLEKTSVRDLSFLKNLKNLRTLDVSETPVSDFSSLEGMSFDTLRLSRLPLGKNAFPKNVQVKKLILMPE